MQQKKSFKINDPVTKDLLFIALVYFFGIFGIKFFDSALFLQTSFVSIIIPLGLYLYRSKPSSKELLLLLIVYLITFSSELIGVNTHYLYGNYDYGLSLGPSIYGVPLLIGLNWVLLAVVSRQILGRLFKNKWFIVVMSAVLMVLIDAVIEPIAPKLDFWSWENNVVPFSNYRDWFIIGIIGQVLLRNIEIKKDLFFWSVGYLVVLLIFFFSFYF